MTQGTDETKLFRDVQVTAISDDRAVVAQYWEEKNRLEATMASCRDRLKAMENDPHRVEAEARILHKIKTSPAKQVSWEFRGRKVLFRVEEEKHGGSPSVPILLEKIHEKYDIPMPVLKATWGGCKTETRTVERAVAATQ